MSIDVRNITPFLKKLPFCQNELILSCLCSVFRVYIMLGLFFFSPNVFFYYFYFVSHLQQVPKEPA